MNNFKKLFVGLIVSTILFSAVLPSVSAITETEKQALIQSISQQIVALQAQITQLLSQETSSLSSTDLSGSAWCYTFNSNLGYANSGSVEVGYLHTALEKQGFSYSPDTGNIYNEGTSQALIKFQKKYGFSQTGYFGKLTRLKFNSLYGCANDSFVSSVDLPLIYVTSPNGGEQWMKGSVKNITWTASGMTNVAIGILNYKYATYNSQTKKWNNIVAYTLAEVPASKGSYSWTVGNLPTNVIGHLDYADKYKIRIYDPNYTANMNYESAVYDFSDNYFSIIQQTDECIDCLTTSSGVIAPAVDGCVPNWKCGEWKEACLNGYQTRICADYNYCNSSEGKPQTSRACSCTPDWQCTTWTKCINGQQTHTCTDINNCPAGSVEKPSETQSCVCAPSWNCSNWSNCFGGKQTRTCSDTENCGINLGKPDLLKSCNNLRVIYPNGGEIWSPGKKYDIKWDVAGTDKVNVWISRYILNNGSVQKDEMTLIEGGIPASQGSYSWTVPYNFTAGNTYIIYINDFYGLLPNDVSDGYFTISATSNTHLSCVNNQCVPVSGYGSDQCSTSADCGTFAVVSPNGGENWQIGTTHNITWQGSNLRDDGVGLWLIDPDDVYRFIGVAKPTSVGSYSWSITSESIPAGTYKIKIQATTSQNELIEDSSNNYFTVSP